MLRKCDKLVVRELLPTAGIESKGVGLEIAEAERLRQCRLSTGRFSW